MEHGVITSHKNDYVSEYETRCNKVKELTALGIQSWPSHKDVTLTAAKAQCLLEDSYENKQTLAGRIIGKREHGKALFCTLQDFTGTIQVYLKADVVGEEAFSFFQRYCDVGDYIWVEGTLFITKRGELTVRVSNAYLLSKCLHSLPEKFSDTEQRYRQRYLDLIVNKEVKDRFIARTTLIKSIRSFLDERCFLEVETPMLHPIPGGAAAKPFVTHHNALGANLFLRIAPELYLKQLVIGGFERVYEINRNFRNEGVSTRHNPEFTMIEFYLAHHDYIYAMSLVEDLIRNAFMNSCKTLEVQYGTHTIDFSTSFDRLTPLQAIIKYSTLQENDLQKSSIDVTLKKQSVTVPSEWSYQQKVFALFEAVAEKNIIHPTYIIDFPIELSPLSKQKEGQHHIAARFELFIAGMEISNGFNELNDPFDQAERFKKQASSREAGDEEAMHYDADYIQALEYGLPPTVGVGIGIDRLVMIATNASTIKDVILFPAMRRKDNEA